MDAEEYAGAEKTLRQALEVNPAHPEAWAYRANLAHLRSDAAAEKSARAEALQFWRDHFQYTAPEQQGQITPSFYDLCLMAEDYEQLAEVAKNQGDSSGWAAALIMEGRKPKVVPAVGANVQA